MVCRKSCYDFWDSEKFQPSLYKTRCTLLSKSESSLLKFPAFSSHINEGKIVINTNYFKYQSENFGIHNYVFSELINIHKCCEQACSQNPEGATEGVL